MAQVLFWLVLAALLTCVFLALTALFVHLGWFPYLDWDRSWW